MWISNLQLQIFLADGLELASLIYGGLHDGLHGWAPISLPEMQEFYYMDFNCFCEKF